MSRAAHTIERIGNIYHLNPDVTIRFEQDPRAEAWADAVRSGEIPLIGNTVVFPEIAQWCCVEEDALEEQFIEEYGRSLRGMREAGKCEVEGSRDTSPIKELRAEYDSAFGEMLKSADGIAEFVRIERTVDYLVEYEYILSQNYTVLEHLVKRGPMRSKEIAETSDSRMIWQAVRDEADVDLLVDFVQPMANNKIPNTNTVFAISAYPEDMEAACGEQFCKELGYNTKSKCAMLQMYHRSENGQLKCRILSIDQSNIGLLAQKLRELGVDVPEDIQPSDLLKHPYLAQMNYSEACSLMDHFVDDYEALQHLPKKIATTQQILQKQSAFRERMFTDYYLDIAKSLFLGHMTTNIANVIHQVISNGEKLGIETRDRLTSIIHREKFIDDDARFMHGVVLYMSAESVRSILHKQKFKLLGSKQTQTNPNNLLSVKVNLPRDPQRFAAQLSVNFTQGIAAGRQYGGCGANFAYSRSNPQHEFGGKYHSDETWNAYEDDAGDGKGPLYFKCLKNHWCKRPFGKKLQVCGKCNDDGASVGCGDKKGKTAKKR